MPVAAAPESAAWQAAMDAAAEGWMLLDAGGRIVAAGRSAERIVGVPSGGLLGRSLPELLGLGDAWEWPPPAGESWIELPAARAADTPLAVALRIGGAAGEHFACALVDLAAERALREQTRRRDRLAVLGELSAGVAHEIRNPLAGIATSAQVLRGRLPEGDEKRRFLDVILEEVARLDRIVTGLLDYARPWTLTLKRTRISECAGKVAALVADRAARQGVALELDFPADLPEIYADPDQLTQVLLNLLRNSLDAMPQGGVARAEGRLVSRAPFVRRTGGRRAGDPVLPAPVDAPPRTLLQLVVSDTGEGIHPDNLSRLFDPFFTTKAAGTGLGLSICQSIIHEHGGSITASSSPGAGTRMTIELPLEKRHGQRRKDG